MVPDPRSPTLSFWDFDFAFSCLGASFMLESVPVVLTAFQLPGRRRWRRHGQDTADRHRGGCGYCKRCQGELEAEERPRRPPDHLHSFILFPTLSQHFDLNLRQFGPYRLNYSRTGR